jgi:heme-degrading monooxygenase HmoA
MYATVVRIPTFGAKESKEIIGGLTKLRESMRPDFIPGFIQTLLLREEKKGAMLVTFWESRQHMHRYMESEGGKGSSDALRKLMGKQSISMEAYGDAWQAVSGVLASVDRLQ